MAFLTPELIALVVLAMVIVFVFLYITSIQKVLEQIGLSRGLAGTILFVTLFLGWIPIPFFLYKGWLIGISLGGGLIPLIVCAYLLRARKVVVADALIGTIIVAIVTYFVTRAEQDIGIVAAALSIVSLLTLFTKRTLRAPLRNGL